MVDGRKLGTIVRGEEIGRVPNRAKFIWVRCPDCHEERWTQYSGPVSATLRICKECAIGRAKHNFYVGTGLEHKPTYKSKGN